MATANNRLAPGAGFTTPETVPATPAPAQQAPRKAALVEYDANGETVKLSPGMIVKYLISGDADRVTEPEVMMFLNLCRFQHLNPFLREAYLIKYGDSPAQMVVGKDVHLKRAMKDPRFRGMQAGIILVTKDGRITEREGAAYIPEAETLIGGWCRVYIDGWQNPFYSAAAFNEYVQLKNGKPNRMWASKPGTMIRKVAVAQALREAFPEANSQLYAPEEMGEASEIELPDTPVIAPETAENGPQAAPEPVKAETPAPSPAAALFG